MHEGQRSGLVNNPLQSEESPKEAPWFLQHKSVEKICNNAYFWKHMFFNNTTDTLGESSEHQSSFARNTGKQGEQRSTAPTTVTLVHLCFDAHTPHTYVMFHLSDFREPSFHHFKTI